MTQRSKGWLLLAMSVGVCGCSGELSDFPGQTAGGSSGTSGGAGGAMTGGSATSGGAATSGGTQGLGGALANGGTAGSVMNTGGGSGGEPFVPTEVATCDDLPAPDLGWHDITPQVFSKDTWEVIGIVVDPYDQSVYAAAGSGPGQGSGIQRSTDCGKTWVLVSTGQNGDKIQTGGQWAMKIDPHPDGPPTLYVTNGYGADPSIYKSTNGGVDFVLLNPDVEHNFDNPSTQAYEVPFIHSLGMDPTDPLHIGVAFHATCNSPRHPLCFSASLDGGETWEMFDGPAQIGSWEEGASLNVLGPTSYLYVGNAGAFYTPDDGTTWTKVGSRGAYCCYGGVTMMLPDGRVLAPLDDGSAPIGVSQGSEATPLGASWTKLEGSPIDAISLISDGERVFAGVGYFSTTYPYHSAPIDDLTNWTPMSTPPVGRAPNQMAYDPVHHVIYSVNWGAGVWRIVTR